MTSHQHDPAPIRPRFRAESGPEGLALVIDAGCVEDRHVMDPIEALALAGRLVDAALTELTTRPGPRPVVVAIGQGGAARPRAEGHAPPMARRLGRDLGPGPGRDGH